ncbi:hypothetical protein [Azohydromonas australica]|uniref:hypothetical protein n=1 Tax=Azohydromonas australica TaxID=364039 RepID=UPI000422B28B|nr:hypothetical protein [Azohydromonas australica]
MTKENLERAPAAGRARLCRAGAVLVAAWLGGCAGPQGYVTFVTKTSLSIVDVDSTPPGVSVAYDRVEGYVGPQLLDGKAPPVTGSIRTDGNLLARNIRQVYATGRAALIVNSPASAPAPAAEAASAPASAASGPQRPVFFGTGTVLGLKFSFSQDGLPGSFTLGYRRKEASVIPVTEDRLRLPSVIAVLSNDVQAGSRDKAGLGLEQYFATGDAADALASDPDIRRAFKAEGQGAVQAYFTQERLQGTAALDTLYCLSRLPDARLPGVWAHAELEKVLGADPGPYQAIRGKPTPAEARTEYTRRLTLGQADDAARTAAYQVHQRYVCALATGTLAP